METEIEFKGQIEKWAGYQQAPSSWFIQIFYEERKMAKAAGFKKEDVVIVTVRKEDPVLDQDDLYLRHVNRAIVELNKAMEHIGNRGPGRVKFAIKQLESTVLGAKVTMKEKQEQNRCDLQ